jgi:hypothetical protein
MTREEMERAGIRFPDDNPEVDLPTVDHSHDFTLDDYDTQQCYYISREQMAPMYIDNPLTVTPVQPDVWTLETDNEHVTFTYEGGAQYSVRLGDIEMSGGSAPDRFVKTGGLVYPMSGESVLLNPHTTPRLAHMREWVLEQTLRISEERLQMAELVNEFAHNIAHLGHAGHDIGHVTGGH